EQKLCGLRGCTANTFLAPGTSDVVATYVMTTALKEQTTLGLPRAPLIANVHFPNQAAQLEALRIAYRKWIDEHKKLVDAVTAPQIQQARDISTGSAATAFADVVKSADAASRVARAEYDKIWQGVYFTSSLNQVLAL